MQKRFRFHKIKTFESILRYVHCFQAKKKNKEKKCKLKMETKQFFFERLKPKKILKTRRQSTMF